MDNERLNSMEVRLDARMTSFENKFDTKIDLVTENRLSRIEEHLRR